MLCYVWHCNCTGYCDEPRNLTNGGKVSNGNTEGDTVTYFCNEGYNLTGDANRTCQSNGSWSGIQPECIRMLNAELKCIMTDCIIMVVALGNIITFSLIALE